jgi:hypothetical protein
MATAVMPKVFKNFVNGEWVESRSGKALENRNPANTSELVGMFPLSSEEDTELAIDAAKAASESWRLVPAPKRGEILFRAAEILTRAQGRLCARHDARNGQGAGGNARGRAGSHRHDLPDGGRRTPAVWADHAVGAAEQICDVACGRRLA